MTATLSGPTIADHKRIIRERLKAEVHQPVPDSIIPRMIASINKESDVILVDAGCVIALSLIEQGHNPDKIFVVEGFGGEYKALAEKMSEIYGFHHIGLHAYELTPMVKFDYFLGNLPFQSGDGGGSVRGSTNAPLWFKIFKNLLTLMKENAEMHFITPVSLFSGGEEFRKYLIGNQSQYDVISVNFDTNSHFPSVGTEMCEWRIRNSNTSDFLTTVDGNRQVNLKQSHFLTADQKFDEVIHTLAQSNGKKLNFNTSLHYDTRQVKKYIERHDLNVSHKCVSAKDDVHKYPVNVNGKIKYGAVEWKDVGIWRIFLPWMPPNRKCFLEVSNEWSAEPSTLTMKFDSEDDCKSVFNLINNEYYLKLMSATIKNGRVNPAIINLLPILSIEEVLSEDQLNYIQSQL